MASEKLSNITDASFESDVLKSTTPVLVDLWATWCGPCRSLAPLLESVAADLDGRLKIVKLDIDSSPKTPAAYGVTSIPTLLLFKDGELVDKMVGNPGAKSKITKFVEQSL